MNLSVFGANNKDLLITRYQSTGDIAAAILKAIKESEKTAKTLAPYFKNSNKYQSCKLIFLFVKNMLPYKQEPASKQTARTLNRILQDNNKGGDCKHYATFTAALCKALNIKCVLRLICQKIGSNQPNHIYCVGIINGKEVIIDEVLKNFDTEARYHKKYDIKIN
jgi:hypothetical protein